MAAVAGPRSLCTTLTLAPARIASDAVVCLGPLLLHKLQTVRSRDGANDPGGDLAALGDDYDSGDDDETSGKFGSNRDFAKPQPGDEHGDRWHEVEQRRRRGDGQMRRDVAPQYEAECGRQQAEVNGGDPPRCQMNRRALTTRKGRTGAS